MVRTHHFERRLAYPLQVEIGEGPFQLWSSLRVHNDSDQPKSVQVRVQGHHYARRADEEGGFLAARSP